MNYPNSISLRGRPGLARRLLWAILVLSAAVPRILAAFLLPNEEGDPYSYFRAIEMMRDSIAGGRFSISELFGFWLPMYQFICALISVVFGHPIYVAKLVSAICGTGVCLLVYVLSVRLTANRTLSVLAFALIAINPIHIMYSAFSLSDVPYALLVMSSLYFAIRNRWVVAASLVAVGGLVRPESWVFIALLPALQWLLRRRVSLTAFMIALSAPLVWIYISWSATGDPLEYFKVRKNYVSELLASNPGLGDISLTSVRANGKTLLYSTGPAVIIASVIAVWLLAKGNGRSSDRRASESSSVAVATAAYFFASLGFLLCAYFTKNQPAIFARYCLVLFALGLPLFAWTLLSARQWGQVSAVGLSVGLFALCFWQFAVQLRDGVSYVRNVSEKRLVANYLKDKFQGDPNLRVFCDDDTVKVLTGIPETTFVGSPMSPSDATSIVSYLKERRVEYLVYEAREGSAAVTLLRELGDDQLTRLFQLVLSSNADLRVYRTAF